MCFVCGKIFVASVRSGPWESCRRCTHPAARTPLTLSQLWRARVAARRRIPYCRAVRARPGLHALADPARTVAVGAVRGGGPIG